MLVLAALLGLLALAFALSNSAQSAYSRALGAQSHALASSQLFGAIDSITSLPRGSMLLGNFTVSSNASISLNGSRLVWLGAGHRFELVLRRQISLTAMNLTPGNYQYRVVSGDPVGMELVQLPADTSKE